MADVGSPANGIRAFEAGQTAMLQQHLVLACAWYSQALNEGLEGDAAVAARKILADLSAAGEDGTVEATHVLNAMEIECTVATEVFEGDFHQMSVLGRFDFLIWFRSLGLKERDGPQAVLDFLLPQVAFVGALPGTHLPLAHSQCAGVLHTLGRADEALEWYSRAERAENTGEQGSSEHRMISLAQTQATDAARRVRDSIERTNRAAAYVAKADELRAQAYATKTGCASVALVFIGISTSISLLVHIP